MFARAFDLFGECPSNEHFRKGQSVLSLMLAFFPYTVVGKTKTMLTANQRFCSAGVIMYLVGSIYRRIGVET